MLKDRTAFWVRGHDGEAAHRVIRDRYGNVADFVIAHEQDGLAALSEKVGRLEQLVFVNGREDGPLFDHLRTDEQWREMRDLTHEVGRAGIPIYCPGAWAVLTLAAGLLAEYNSKVLPTKVMSAFRARRAVNRQPR